MPMRLNVGLSKKIGQPDYGSLGASCHVEIELDGGLLQNDLDSFHRHVQDAFAACRQAVDDQLAEEQHGPTNGATPASNGNDGNGSANGNGHTGKRRSNGRLATASQVRAIHAIANRQRLDLAGELRGRFGVDRPDDLTIGEASELIDAIKPEASGSNGGRR